MTKNKDFEDFEDFEDLDVVLNSKEFINEYNNTPYHPTGKSWSGNRNDYTGMTIEDISGFPATKGYYPSTIK